MVLAAFLLATFAVAVCAIGIRYALAFLGLRPMQTLLYLGLAEVPAPPTSRRRTPPGARLGAVQ